MPFLRRYTDLTELLHILKSKTITLLDPQLWDNKNDLYFMNTYKEKANFKSVLALCFTETFERYHHWKVFTKGSSGVCIVFNKLYLKESFPRDDDKLRFSPVFYNTINYIKKYGVKNYDLPFVKPYPYRSEYEYRIIYTDSELEIKFKEYPIDLLPCISKIVLSPWLPEALFDSVKGIIKGIEGAAKIPVQKSNMVYYAQWKDVADDVAASKGSPRSRARRDRSRTNDKISNEEAINVFLAAESDLTSLYPELKSVYDDYHKKTGKPK